jgi:carbamoyl-phosphate synthase small subunit
MGGILLLEDGKSFTGEAYGAKGTRVGEVVFNTAMTGYQEVLTDPSYAEQIVVMTAVHIGNTGVNDEDPESDRVWPSGFVARRFSRVHSNHRAQAGLDQYLRQAGVPSMHGIDTRALVRHLRDKGAMRAVVSTDGTPADELWRQLQAWPGMVGRSLALEVGTRERILLHDPASPRLRVALVDGGAKHNIGRLLAQAGCRVELHPIDAAAESWMDGNDLVFLSNGPGDPAALPGVVEQVQRCIGKRPVVGICLGHQLLGLAVGARTFKLPFGHRGANHPVRDEETGRVEVTSQNHGFCVDFEELKAAGGRVTHVNLNDGTLAGFRHDEKGVMGVQFHPESCPGPRDSAHLVLNRFLEFAEARRPAS